MVWEHPGVSEAVGASREHSIISEDVRAIKGSGGCRVIQGFQRMWEHSRVSEDVRAFRPQGLRLSKGF